MQVVDLDHAAMIVADVHVSRRFYAEVLLLDEVARPATFDFPGAWFRRGSAEIHLIGEAAAGRAASLQPTYHPPELQRGYVPHIALRVADISAAQAHLARLGVPIVGGPQQRGDGITQLYVRDPDGYVIELFGVSA